MRVLFINNEGGGFADYLEVAEGTPVEEFFGQQLPDRNPEDFLIRVNRQPVPANYVLQEGDRVTMTPVKIEGGRLRKQSLGYITPSTHSNTRWGCPFFCLGGSLHEETTPQNGASGRAGLRKPATPCPRPPAPHRYSTRQSVPSS